MKRYQLIIEGRVQGVGFRSFCQMHAYENHLTGTVRNMDNDMVELFVQGEEDSIRTFIHTIQQGNMFIRVDSISSKEKPVQIEEKSFRISY